MVLVVFLFPPLDGAPTLEAIAGAALGGGLWLAYRYNRPPP
jgi:hypothetical protein